MSDSAAVEVAVEIIEEWHHWDGFREGVVRIKHPAAFHSVGDLYYATATSDWSEDGPWEYEARSLFHLVDETLEHPSTGALPDPGVFKFTSGDVAF